jgi:hypothetical protein
MSPEPKTGSRSGGHRGRIGGHGKGTRLGAHLVLGAALAVLATSCSALGGPDADPDPDPPSSCIEFPQNIETEIDRPVEIQAKVEFEACVNELLLATSTRSFDEPTQRIVRTGGRVRVQLSEPELGSRLTPVHDSDHFIAALGDVGYWVWQVNPDKPGVYSLTLTVSVLTDTEDVVAFSNEPMVVNLTVRDSIGFQWNKLWTGLISLLTPIAAVVGMLGAIAAGIAPLRRVLWPRDARDPDPSSRGSGSGRSAGMRRPRRMTRRQDRGSSRLRRR